MQDVVCVCVALDVAEASSRLCFLRPGKCIYVVGTVAFGPTELEQT